MQKRNRVALGRLAPEPAGSGEAHALATEHLRGARRIHLCGPPGAGKSTLAMTLHRRLGLPLIHLDQEFWGPDWTPMPLPQWFEKTETLALRPEWIIDGTYSRTLYLRLPHAEAVVLLDYPRWLCLWRVCRRWLRHWGQQRADMAAGCRERLTLKFFLYVWRFHRREMPVVFDTLQLLDPDQLLLVFRSPRELRKFLDVL